MPAGSSITIDQPGTPPLQSADARGPGTLVQSGVADDVRLAQAGDREAFGRIYRVHVSRIYALCARMTGDRLRAEELTQDAFVRAWEKLGLFRGESSFGTWLHRVAVNVVLNARKRDAERARTSVSLDEQAEDGGVWIATTATVGESAVRVAGEWGDVEAAIRGLPMSLRRVLVLHDVEGYQHREIAALLGIAVGNSKSRLHRARLILRRALADTPAGVDDPVTAADRPTLCCVRACPAVSGVGRVQRTIRRDQAPIDGVGAGTPAARGGGWSDPVRCACGA